MNPITDRCKDCNYAEASAENPKALICRRYPPTLFSVIGFQASRLSPGGAQPLSTIVRSLPEMNGEEDWCGEFERRDE